MFQFPLPQFNQPMQFNQTYRCYSVAMLGPPKSTQLESGGKIILPASALDLLARLRIEYPMLFELSKSSQPSKKTHCGVLEFTADEGCCHMPYWMMQLLLVDEGGFVNVRSATLPKAKYVKLQPQSSSFLDISNPKAVLENRLRNYSALTQGDVIRIEYNKNWYDIGVIEVKPVRPSIPAVSIVETDVDLDFAPPLDYIDKKSANNNNNNTNNNASSSAQPIPTSDKRSKMEESDDDSDEDDGKKFKAFTGTAYTLKSPTGKSPAKSPAYITPSPKASSSPVYKAASSKEEEEDSDSDDDKKKKSFQPFTGTGYKLK